MKVQKCKFISVISAILVLTLALSLFAGLTVFAAEGNILDPIYDLGAGITSGSGIQLLCFDVTIPTNTTCSYAFRLLNDDGTYEPYGHLRLTKDGKVTASQRPEDWGADWLENGSYNISTYTLGEKLSVMAKLNMNTGTVDFYLNGSWIRRQSGTGNTKWYGLAVISDTANVKPIVDVKYSVGLTEDKVQTTYNVGSKNKKLNFEFSEAVSGNLDGTQLVRINGGTTVKLSNPTVVDNKVTYDYAEALKPSSEYVVIFPDELKGAKYQNELSDRYLYFWTDDVKVTTETLIDFEEGYDPDTDGAFVVRQATAPYSVKSTLTTTGGKDGSRGITVKSDEVTQADKNAKNNANKDIKSIDKPMNWVGITIPQDTQIQTISFDIKPLQENFAMATRMLPNNDNKPLMIGFSKNNDFLGGYDWDIYNFLEEPDNWWGPRLKRGTYKTNEWSNVTVEWDKTRKKGYIYLDDMLTTITTTEKDPETSASDFAAIDHIRMHMYQCLMGIESADVELFALDNIYVSGGEKPAVVKSVIFTDANNNEVKALGKLKTPLKSVALTFSDDMPLKDVATLDNIKLYYGEDEIGYTAAYNETDKTYTITPSVTTVSEAGKEYKVTINGLMAKNDLSVEDYSCTAQLDAESLINAEFDLVGANGETVTAITPGLEYMIKAKFNSMLTSVSKASVLIAEYSTDNCLTKITVEEISADKNIDFTIDADAESYPGRVDVFVWQSVGGAYPLCKSVSVPVNQ